MIVTLTPAEQMIAAIVGVFRVIACIQDGRKNRFGEKGAGWLRHTEGAIAEQCVSKLFDIHWKNSVNTFKSEPDVGKYQVRGTTRPDGRLILHPDDKDEEIFILVIIGNGLAHDVIGWCTGKEGKQQQFWETFTGRPCFFVPRDALWSMEELLP